MRHIRIRWQTCGKTKWKINLFWQKKTHSWPLKEASLKYFMPSFANQNNFVLLFIYCIWCVCIRHSSVKLDYREYSKSLNHDFCSHNIKPSSEEKAEEKKHNLTKKNVTNNLNPNAEYMVSKNSCGVGKCGTVCTNCLNCLPLIRSEYQVWTLALLPVMGFPSLHLGGRGCWSRDLDLCHQMGDDLDQSPCSWLLPVCTPAVVDI